MKKILLIFLCLFSFAAYADDGLSKSIAADLEYVGSSLQQDFSENARLKPDYVPIEAKMGAGLISALASVVNATYEMLIPFLNILIAALLIFWILMETWQMMKSQVPDYTGLITRLVKKVAMIAIWMWVMNHNPAELFMWLVGPVVSVGTAVSDMIFKSTSGMINSNLPDTCASIHNWLANNKEMIISGEQAANLLCIPTKAASVFYTNVAMGFSWMMQGLAMALPAFALSFLGIVVPFIVLLPITAVAAQGAITFIMGFVFVALFIYNIWKFFITALGVIVDLFFVLLFLPFTAVKECFSDSDIKYDGLFKPIFTGFVGLVNGISLSKQVMKFINVAIYFVVLSVVCAITVSLMDGAGNSFMAILICGCIAAYLMGQTDKISEKLSEKMDSEFADQLESILKGWGKGITGFGKKTWGVVKDFIPGKK